MVRIGRKSADKLGDFASCFTDTEKEFPRALQAEGAVGTDGLRWKLLISSKGNGEACAAGMDGVNEDEGVGGESKRKAGTVLGRKGRAACLNGMSLSPCKERLTKTKEVQLRGCCTNESRQRMMVARTRRAVVEAAGSGGILSVF